MRWIFRYNEQAAKYLGKLTHTKIKPEPQPWLHVAVKTMSARNPWAGYVIYIWDTREVVGEYRSNKGLFTTEQFKLANCGMQRAVDNHEPLVGGRKDINEFFEFGKFDASHSDVFGDDGKRVTKTPLYTKRAKKAGLEDFDFATESQQLNIRPGQRVVVQDFNLDQNDKLAPEKPKVGTLQKIATYGDVVDNGWFKHPENAQEFFGTRRSTTLYLVDDIWYKPYKNKYGACVIKAAK